MTKYAKRQLISCQEAPPPQEFIEHQGMIFRRKQSLIFHTPDFPAFETTVRSVQQTYKEGIAHLDLSANVEDLLVWIIVSMYPKTSLLNTCTLAHNTLRLHFPTPRKGKSKNLFDIINYDNVIVTENEVKVSGVKVVQLPSIAERKVFNPKQLSLF